jgi:hypothetical protein
MPRAQDADRLPGVLNAYEANRLRAERTLGVDGLLSVGRNGEFAHIFMEEVYWRTRRKMRALFDYWKVLETRTSASVAPGVWSAVSTLSGKTGGAGLE